MCKIEFIIHTIKCCLGNRVLVSSWGYLWKFKVEPSAEPTPTKDAAIPSQYLLDKSPRSQINEQIRSWLEIRFKHVWMQSCLGQDPTKSVQANLFSVPKHKIESFFETVCSSKAGLSDPSPQGLQPTGFCDLPGRRLGENCFLPDGTENWVGLPPLRTGSRCPCSNRTVPDLFRHGTSLQRGVEVCFECCRAPADVWGHVRQQQRLRLLFPWAACC